MKPLFYFAAFFSMLCINLYAQELPPVKINVTTAGTLSSLIPLSQKDQVTNLTLTGNLNGTDIAYIREMAGRDINEKRTTGKLAFLDLSGANIVDGGDPYYISFGKKYTSSINCIGNYAFRNCDGLISVSIPNSVTTIGNSAFYNCSCLTSVSIPNSVTTIGGEAFSYSRLNSVSMPNSVTTIGDYAFANCNNLTSIAIPNSITTIGDGIFSYCINLTSVSIPNSVTTIGPNAFYFTCLRSVTIPNSVTSIGYKAFYDCRVLTSVLIPNSVTTIGDYAFANCYSLTSITIPTSVTTIGEGAFKFCSGLSSITISENVTTIGEGAFYNCTGLSSITIPNSVKAIGDGAFCCAFLKEIKVLEHNSAYRSIDGVLFNKDCSKLIFYPQAISNGYIIPNSVTTIGEGAFYNCTGLSSITIPNSVTTIGDGAFFNCTGLSSITIPNSVTTIGDGVFFNCRFLKEIKVLEHNSAYRSIGGVLFNKDCSKLIFYPPAVSNDYIIPNSVTTIDNAAFYTCSSLTSITIPESLTTIGEEAFMFCSNIGEIHCNALTPPLTPPINSSFIFPDALYKTCKLYIPKDTYSRYSTDSFWSNFANIIEKESSSKSDSDGSKIKVFTEDCAIIVEGGKLGAFIEIYASSGLLLRKIRIMDDVVMVDVAPHDIYLVKIGEHTSKIALK